MAKWIRHNQGTFVGIILAVVLLIWTYGCQSKVMSPVSDKMVTRPELRLEVEVQVKQLEADIERIQKQAELQFAELDRLEDIKSRLFEFASLTASQGTFNPTGIVTLAGTLLGLGTVIDNRIKDKVIKNRPLNNVQVKES